MKRLNNFIVSDTKGRMRLRVPALKNLKTAERMLEELKTLEGVRKADVNQITGSVLLEYDPHTFERRGLAHVFNEVVPHAKPLPTLSHRTKKMLRSKEMRLFENKGMLVCGLTSLAALAFKGFKLHTAAGAVFVALAAHKGSKYSLSDVV